MKKIINISIWIILSIGLIVLLSFVKNEHKKIKCPDLEISIDYGDGNDYFITAGELEDKIIHILDTVEGRKISDIDLELLERELKKIAYLKDAEAYLTIDGKLKVEVLQRHAIVKIIKSEEDVFYVSEDGTFMPLHPDHTAHVIIVNGVIEDTVGNYKSDIFKVNQLEDTSRIREVFSVINLVKNNEFLTSLVEQVYVNSKGDFELIPKIGNQLIMFGDTLQQEEKFKKLISFYKHGKGKVDWNSYDIIDLRFSNQVVCTKN